MRVVRVLLGVLGLAALAWGAYMAYPMAKDIWTWFIGPAVLDDAVVLPVAGLVSLAVARWAGAAWRWPLHFGIGATALICYLGFTEAWRPYGFPPKPGLHDRDYVSGVLITLAVLWGVVLLVGLLRARSLRLRARVAERDQVAAG